MARVIQRAVERDAILRYPRTTRDAHARNRRVTFAIDAFAPEEPVPNARALVDECDVPPPVDVCVTPAEAVRGSPP